MMRFCWTVSCAADCAAWQDISVAADEAEARWLARCLGWATKGRGRGERWFCPFHVREMVGWKAKHEEWCPASTRNGPCSCTEDPDDGDEASWRAMSRPGNWGRGVEVVRVAGDILLRSS